MKSEISDPKEHYKQINLYFIVLFLGIVILFGASVFLRITGNFRFTFRNYEETGLIFKILLVIFIIILYPASYLVHKRKIENLKKTANLSEKLSGYKTSLMIKFIIIEYLCIFNLFTFFFFGNPYLLIPVSVFLLILLMNRPTLQKIGVDLNLSTEDKEMLL